MVSPADVSAQLSSLSAEQLSLPVGELRAEAVLTDDLGVDSLAAIEWGMVIEDEFAIALPEDAWESVTTYGRLDELVRRLVQARTPVPQPGA